MLENLEKYQIKNQEVITGGSNNAGNPECFGYQGN